MQHAPAAQEPDAGGHHRKQDHPVVGHGTVEHSAGGGEHASGVHHPCPVRGEASVRRRDHAQRNCSHGEPEKQDRQGLGSTGPSKVLAGVPESLGCQDAQQGPGDKKAVRAGIGHHEKKQGKLCRVFVALGVDGCEAEQHHREQGIVAGHHTVLVEEKVGEGYQHLDRKRKG